MTDIDIISRAIELIRKSMSTLEHINDEIIFDEINSLYQTLDDVQIDMTNTRNTLKDEGYGNA